MIFEAETYLYEVFKCKDCNQKFSMGNSKEKNLCIT